MNLKKELVSEKQLNVIFIAVNLFFVFYFALWSFFHYKSYIVNPAQCAYEITVTLYDLRYLGIFLGLYFVVWLIFLVHALYKRSGKKFFLAIASPILIFYLFSQISAVEHHFVSAFCQRQAALEKNAVPLLGV